MGSREGSGCIAWRGDCFPAILLDLCPIGRSGRLILRNCCKLLQGWPLQASCRFRFRGRSCHRSRFRQIYEQVRLTWVGNFQTETLPRIRQALPVGAGHTSVTFTSYLGVEGTNQTTSDGVLFLDSRVSLLDIRDGTSNTLMVGERPPSADLGLGWWYAGWGQELDGSAEMILGVQEIINLSRFPGCSPDSTEYRKGQFNNLCDALHFWSPHLGGANFLFADGSVHFLPYSAAPLMPALATRNGGEAVTIPD